MRGRDGPRLFRYRRDQEPVVADQVVTIWIRDVLHRNERRRSRGCREL